MSIDRSSAPRRSWVGLTAALTVAVLAGTSIGAPVSVRGAAPASTFYFESEPGDPIAVGRAGRETSDDSTFGAYNDSSFTTSVGVNGPLGWWLIYAFGPGGAQLTPGTTYTDAAYLNEADPSHATLAPFWSGEGSCEFNSGSVGAFTVHDVAYANGLFTKLSMSFHIDCGGASGSLDGEVRFNATSPAYGAIVQSPMTRSAGAFADTPIGGTSATATFTLTNAGDGALTLGNAAKSGSDPADFQVVADGCSGTVLAPGDACHFGVRMHPSAFGDRSALLSFAVGTASGHRRIALSGKALTATTTTLAAPSGLVFGPVTVSGHVSPAPQPANGFIPAINFLVNGNLSAAAPLDQNGDGTDELHLDPGTYSVVAAFGGFGDLAASQSDPVTFEVGVTTTTALVSDLDPALSTQPITLTATLTSQTGGAIDGGTLSLTDESDGSTLGSIAVGPGSTELTVTTMLAVGDHPLKASYSGHGSFGPSSAQLVQTVTVDQAVDATDVGISYSKFYPVKDGYRDQLGVWGTRHEPISVSIDIYSVATGKRVRTATVALGSDRYVWTWNGRTAAGKLVKAGRYRVVQTLTDSGSNQMVSTAFATLSLKKVVWKTVSTTVRGSAYSLVLDTGNGYVSKARSSYAGGVKVASGTAAAGVQYRFRIVKGTIYKNISFKVLGRSPNGRKAFIAIWDPDLGSYLYVDSFDAVRQAGPGYRWWSTSAPLTNRVRGGYARAVVIVAYSSGKVIFDISKVRVTYKIGVLR